MEITTCETDADYEDWRSVRIAVVPYERCQSVEQMRAEDNPSRLLVVAREDGVLVGSGIADLADSAATGFVAPRVLPEHRRRGHGTELLRLLTDHVVSLGLPRVRAAADDEESLAFARAFGFEVVDHDVEQSRSVDDLPPLTEPPDGVEVVLESERPGLWADCFETFGREALAGFALSTAIDISLERWTSSSWRADPMFLALHDGEVVGCAGLYQDTDQPERAEHGLTAVRGDWRGRGLAAHLKLRTLHWAAEHGLREVYTWTQDGNAAMRGLNTKLGYATTRTGAQVARDLPL